VKTAISLSVLMEIPEHGLMLMFKEFVKRPAVSSCLSVLMEIET